MMMGTAEAQEYWNSETKLYIRAGGGLTEVPSDIPAQAVTVVLGRNQIEVIRENVFNHLKVCEELYLSINKIKTIEIGAFNGLDSLRKLLLGSNEIEVIKQNTFVGLTQCTELYLDRNKIHTIESGALDGMKSLTLLWLEDNNLSTLPWTVFGKEHPANLALALGDPESSSPDNPIICNSTSLCWVKQGEQDQWFKWYKFSKEYKPECSDTDADWDDISLDCSHLGMSDYNFLHALSTWFSGGGGG